MKNVIKICLTILLLTSISCSNEPISNTISDSENFDTSTRASHKSTVDVFNPILGQVTGSSTLHRTNNGITVNYRSTELSPGYAYTLWWVIWNNPEDCGIPGECADTDFGSVEVEVLYGSGHVVGNNGVGNFSARLNVGDVSGSINALFGLPPAGGLQSGNTLSAEVHLVLRSHGPAIPGLINEQIGSYVGGCTDPFAIAPFTEIPDEVGECGDIEFAIHPPVN